MDSKLKQLVSSSQPQNQIVCIWQSIDLGTSQFTASIFLDFMPDVMIVKSIHYYNADNEEGADTSLFVSLLTSNIINSSDVSGGILGSFTNSLVPSCQNLSFNMKKEIRGTFNFQILQSIHPSQPDLGRNGIMAIILDFVKY